MIDGGEECDGGEDCSNACTVVSIWENTNWPLVGGMVGMAGLGGGGVLLLRNMKKVKKSKPSKPTPADSPASIDDIPLDELEMPWHKWEG